MSLGNFYLILAGVLLTTGAQLLLKAGAQMLSGFDIALRNPLRLARLLASNGFIVAGVVCYGVSMMLWILALSRVDVSVAYPMLALGYPLTAVAAAFLFAEPLTLRKGLGIAVIILGVGLVALG